MNKPNKKAVTFDIKGIKCDNPACDYKDMEADFEPEKYLNAPCPKCGANLFTEEDWKTMKLIMGLADAVNEYAGPIEGEYLRAPIHMNGSGKIKIGDGE